MPSFICPNDGGEMVSDQPQTKRQRELRGNHPDTHICTECGYTEIR